MTRAGWASSLRFRLLAATVLALSVALLLAGLLLSGFFKQEVERQFEATLRQQLDQLTSSLEFNTAGELLPMVRTLPDPRWQRPYSGLYWQIDGPENVQRSRSLWDAVLTLPADPLSDGQVHAHQSTGPQGARLLVLERSVHAPEFPASAWRVAVAADTRSTQDAVKRFGSVLVFSLSALLLLLVLAAFAQVYVGLRPLRSLEQALKELREGRSQALQGNFPQELLPLTGDFNRILERQAQTLARARQQAGNLAHAVKTPLAVLSQAVTQSQTGSAGTSPAPLAQLVQLVNEQVALAKRHIDWHLARARSAGAQRLPGQRTPVAPALAGLVRVMQRVHAARELRIELDAPGPADPTDAGLVFAGEEQDLQEMLGNLLDNACKWARHQVCVQALALPRSNAGGQLLVRIEDDGAGIDESLRLQVMSRGVRADESVPGSGLGLAIVADLVALYGGSLQLGQSALGGLKVELLLPSVQ
jgi:signal transduction histidine kinase